ncbi:hypothetical protein BJ546DRAFT_438049 [Cryomyces antarcticus]
MMETPEDTTRVRQGVTVLVFDDYATQSLQQSPLAAPEHANPLTGWSRFRTSLTRTLKTFSHKGALEKRPEATLLGLPLELRLKIFSYVFPAMGLLPRVAFKRRVEGGINLVPKVNRERAWWCLTSATKEDAPWTYAKENEEKALRITALLRTSKQIHSEAADFLYSHFTFGYRFDDPLYVSPEDPYQWRTGALYTTTPDDLPAPHRIQNVKLNLEMPASSKVPYTSLSQTRYWLWVWRDGGIRERIVTNQGLNVLIIHFLNFDRWFKMVEFNGQIHIALTFMRFLHGCAAGASKVMVDGVKDETMAAELRTIAMGLSDTFLHMRFRKTNS